MKTTKGERIAYDLMQLVDAHSAWSDKTFGTPAKRGPAGPLKHLAKEALETLASPNDPLEYADCLLLILDSSRRAGFDLETLIHATLAKLAVNKGRKWPKQQDSNEPVEHSKPFDESDKLDEQIIQQAETDGLKPLPEPEPKLVITIPEETFSCAICGQLFPMDQLIQGRDEQGITVHICRKCFEAGSFEALMKLPRDWERKCDNCLKSAVPGLALCQECLDNIPF